LSPEDADVRDFFLDFFGAALPGNTLVIGDLPRLKSHCIRRPVYQDLVVAAPPEK